MPELDIGEFLDLRQRTGVHTALVKEQLVTAVALNFPSIMSISSRYLESVDMINSSVIVLYMICVPVTCDVSYWSTI